ncbi:MAG: hypothetical protein IT385_12675 [Deltaproteobacteria bacterium]|nr:hypothetical protein [Deltaproteobacteria bacterium]
MKVLGTAQCKLQFSCIVTLTAAVAACGDDDAGGQGDLDVTQEVAEVISFDAETSAPDVASEIEVSPGGFGAPCVESGDCDSGYCIQSADGFTCTITCVEDCPTGYGCRAVTSGSADVTLLCVPNITTFCRPCQVDRECPGGLCLDFAGGSFCTRPCEDECPIGFSCGDVETPSGEPARGCVPTSGTCECSESTVEAVRGCEVTTIDGTCEGVQVCALGEGGYDWTTCSARIPIGEVCDFVDNDCDGAVDEGFTDDEGDYTTDENCGYCGASCVGAIPNATATCDAALDPPQCVVDECVAGFFELSPFFCGQVPARLCNACDTAESCVVEGALCTTFDDGDFCTVPCAGAGDCPAGYACAPIDGAGPLQCQPTSGTCVCDDGSIGLQRGCERTNTVGGVVTTCVGLETCAAQGWGECALGADLCDNVDNDCNGVVDDPWIDADGVYFRDEHCGICGNNCKADVPANATRVCDASGDVPRCVVVCAEGTADIDGNPLNGCECDETSDTDLPDGTDQNCDGIDGEIDNGVFVARTGDDSAAGTIDDPLLTVQAGVDRAASLGRRDVYVATGVYAESVTLTSGVTVYGGYSGDYHRRDRRLYETALLAGQPTRDQPGAVNAVGITAASGLVGFTVFGASPETAGASAYTIWIVDSGDALRIADNTIDAGDGAAGAPGGAGASGTTGVPGVGGGAAKDIGDGTCGASDHNLGGAGGPRTCGGVDVGGGAGGAAICPDYNESAAADACPVTSSQAATAVEAGAAGRGAAPGGGGAAGLDVFTSRAFGPYSATPCADANANCSVCHVPSGAATGGDGAAGAPGVSGLAGEGCADADGAVVDHRWVAAGATAGSDGGAGSGGGGGGAAGGVETFGCGAQGSAFSDIGGSGGGGGSGGCGAAAGTAGGSGGGSFAIFVSWSASPTSRPVIVGNEVRPGAGGAGGNGGLGGTGGAGGAAGPGGLGGASAATVCAPRGGAGGAGGNGGHGGGGGGGCGGPSFGIFVAGGAGDPAWKSGNTIAGTARAGAAGAGGPSLGATGGSGLEGAEGAASY